MTHHNFIISASELVSIVATYDTNMATAHTDPSVFHGHAVHPLLADDGSQGRFTIGHVVALANESIPRRITLTATDDGTPLSAAQLSKYSRALGLVASSVTGDGTIFVRHHAK